MFHHALLVFEIGYSRVAEITDMYHTWSVRPFGKITLTQCLQAWMIKSEHCNNRMNERCWMPRTKKPLAQGKV
jgi:hypothetical protein